jgi:hypothetical protein
LCRTRSLLIAAMPGGGWHQYEYMPVVPGLPDAGDATFSAQPYKTPCSLCWHYCHCGPSIQPWVVEANTEGCAWTFIPDPQPKSAIPSTMAPFATSCNFLLIRLQPTKGGPSQHCIREWNGCNYSVWNIQSIDPKLEVCPLHWLRQVPRAWLPLLPQKCS